MIQLKGVSKTFGGNTVVHDVDLSINPAEFVVLSGPSGAGKTTLLHLILGVEAPTKGVVSIDRHDLQKLSMHELRRFRRRTGIVFQDYRLLHNQTVEENVSYPLIVMGLTEEERKQRVRDVLKLLGMQHQLHTFTNALSGGEKARVAIARAIVHKPLIILADEPTANLDPEQRRDVLEILFNLHRSGTTVIIATHHTDIHPGARTLKLNSGWLVHDTEPKHNLQRTGEKHRVLEQGRHHVKPALGEE